LGPLLRFNTSTLGKTQERGVYDSSILGGFEVPARNEQILTKACLDQSEIEKVTNRKDERGLQP